MEEIWKDIEGFPGYQVSDLGRVRSFKNSHNGFKETPAVLALSDNSKGYLHCTLVKNGHAYTKRVNRLVGQAFIPNPDNKPEVNHKNGDKTDNRASNLEWNTRLENMEHAMKTGLKDSGEKIKVVETGIVYRNAKKCAAHMGLGANHIYECLDGKRKTCKGFHFERVESLNKRKPFLYDYQLEAVNQLRNGSILCGSVGAGKSRAGLFYYFKENGGWIDENGYIPMKNPQDLYIITTAKKRDSCEWTGELSNFLMSDNLDVNYYKNKIVVESWNNFPKFKDVKGAFFLLDEQRLVSNGSWVKTFLKIAKNNNWILLTATPGDSYVEYLPVFLANGFFKNRTEFNREHVIYSRFTKYPKIERYVNTRRLDRLRDRVLVKMNYQHQINTHHEDVYCNYDISMCKDAMKNRWNPYTQEPIINASGLCYILRRIVNSDESRQMKLLELLEDIPRAIIFYSFDYEREILLNLGYRDGVEVAEWSGHAHMPIPDGEKWVYICQYTSACEGWECTRTNVIIFYSQNYSYKVMTQAAGRIDRLNTPYTDLYYYHLKSRSGIDLAISRALSQKRNFNEGKYVGDRFS